MARYWEWNAPFKIDPKETALIIVDMQRGFVDEGFCFFTMTSTGSATSSAVC